MVVVRKTTITDTIATVGNTKPAVATFCFFGVPKTVRNNQFNLCFFVFGRRFRGIEKMI